MTSPNQGITPPTSGSERGRLRRDPSADTQPTQEQEEWFDSLDALEYLGRCDDATEMPPIPALEEKPKESERRGPSEAGG